MTRSFPRGIGAALLGALAALVMLASAHAGGWSVTVLDRQSTLEVGGVLRPGVAFDVGFTVLQHGKHPVAGLTPLITLTPEGSGTPVEVTAVASGEPGHYVASITLPEPGVWRWKISAFGPPSVMAPLTVAAAPPPPPPTPAVVPLALPTAVALALLATLALIILSARRRAAAAP